ncbi:MAG: hypothetical protein AAFQ82_09485 [Myxococcota bacterium]
MIRTSSDPSLRSALLGSTALSTTVPAVAPTGPAKPGRAEALMPEPVALNAPANPDTPWTLDPNRVSLDGKLPQERAFIDARTQMFFDGIASRYPETVAAAQSIRARVAPQSAPRERDYQGKVMSLGGSATLTGPDGQVETLVPAALVPEGKSIVEIQLSGDPKSQGKFVAFALGDQSDQRIWHVIERDGHRPVLGPIVTDLGSVAFSPDESGVYYPNNPKYQTRADRILFQSLATGEDGRLASRPQRVPGRTASNGIQVYPLNAEQVLTVPGLRVGNLPAFPVFGQIAQRSSGGDFLSDARPSIRGGRIGRLVSADENGIIYQASRGDGRFALVKLSGADFLNEVEIVPDRGDELLHTAERIGDKLFTWNISKEVEPQYTLRVYDLDGNSLLELTPQKLGQLAGCEFPSWSAPIAFSGDANSTKFTDFTVSSLGVSPRTFRIDLETLEVSARLTGKEKALDLDPSTYEVKHSWVKGEDGHSIPVRRTIPRNKSKDTESLGVLFGYSFIGFQYNRGWYPLHHLMLMNGVEVWEGATRGGPMTHSEGAQNRALTISDRTAIGREMKRVGLDRTGSYGRSNAGATVVGSAALDPDVFDVAIANVPAGDLERIFGLASAPLPLPDYGMIQEWDGSVANTELALGQIEALNTPRLIEDMANPRALPPLLYMIRKEDDRVPHGGAVREVATIERERKEANPDAVSLVELPGGHSQRGDEGHFTVLSAFLRHHFGPAFAPVKPTSGT